MPRVVLLLWILLCKCALESTVQSLVLLVSDAELIENVLLYKNGMELPQFLLSYDLNSFEDNILRVDSGRAFFDTIVLVQKKEGKGGQSSWELGDAADTGTLRVGGGLTVFDSGKCVWEGTYSCGFECASSTKKHRYDIAAAITARPLSRPRIVDVFPYNGDFVALFRLQYLFDSVDEFIIVEARTTFSGSRKPTLLFTSEENTALFAPFMSKITYVVLEEFPPYPDGTGDSSSSSWLTFSDSYSDELTEQLNSMLRTPNFWRANYQRLFSKFFLRPPAALGERQLILVTDCDELPNRTQFGAMHDRIRPQQYSLQHTPIPLFMMFFYYNFNTVNPFAWLQPYAISTEGFLGLTDMLSPRIPPSHSLPGAAQEQGGEARYIQEGGWHLSYFMSLAEIRRKMDSIADQSFYNTNPSYKSDAHIQHCIENSLDLYLRSGSISSAWVSRSRLQVHSFPEGWQQLQRQLEQLQASSAPATSYVSPIQPENYPHSDSDPERK